MVSTRRVATKSGYHDDHRGTKGTLLEGIMKMTIKDSRDTMGTKALLSSFRLWKEGRTFKRQNYGFSSDGKHKRLLCSPPTAVPYDAFNAYTGSFVIYPNPPRLIDTHVIDILLSERHALFYSSLVYVDYFVASSDLCYQKKAKEITRFFIIYKRWIPWELAPSNTVISRIRKSNCYNL